MQNALALQMSRGPCATAVTNAAAAAATAAAAKFNAKVTL